MKLDLEDILCMLTSELLEKGFETEEIDQFYNGYGRYMAEGMTELCKYIHQNPEASKEDIIEVSKKIQDYFWYKDHDNAEEHIRGISTKMGYQEELVKAAMVLIRLCHNTTTVVNLFDTITDERELALEIINRLEKRKEENEKLEIFKNAEKHVCEIFAAKSFNLNLLEDVKLAMAHTYHRHIPVEYDVIVNLVEISKSEEDLVRKFAPIFAVVMSDLDIDENCVD